MTAGLATRIAAAFGFLAVALGAFGAHSLHGILMANQAVSIWEKAVFYHITHAVVMLVIALTARDHVPAKPFICFALGIVIFSGSLYTLAFTNIRWFGAITPAGGALLLVGWGFIACRSFGRAE